MRKEQSGFTILELLIATTVFGVMMLFATTGMIEIGRAYYKGITSSKTQEVSRAVERDLANTIQQGGNTVDAGVLPSGLPADTAAYDIKSYCFGKNRYTYALDVKASEANSPTDPKSLKHVLWYDQRDNENDECVALDLTQDNPSTGTPSSNTDLSVNVAAQRRDLLSTNMRLANFDVSARGPGATVIVKVMYGDRTVIDDNATPDNPKDDICRTNRLGGQFCAYSELKSYVSKR